MRLIASYQGKNRDFRAWLAAQKYPGKVVSLAEYREKKKTASAAKMEKGKPFRPIIA